MAIKAETIRRKSGEAVGVLSRTLAENHGVRVALTGAAFVILGLNLGSASAWTIPALAVGTVLILAGVLGTRLSGKLSLEWGEDGASFEMRARIAPPQRRRADPAPELPEGAGETRLQVIDSTGETIEMDLIELRRLLPDRDPAEAGSSAS